MRTLDADEDELALEACKTLKRITEELGRREDSELLRLEKNIEPVESLVYKSVLFCPKIPSLTKAPIAAP